MGRHDGDGAPDDDTQTNTSTPVMELPETDPIRDNPRDGNVGDGNVGDKSPTEMETSGTNKRPTERETGAVVQE